jgi:hypothetical protein
VGAVSGPTPDFVDEAKECLTSSLRLVDPPRKVRVCYERWDQSGSLEVTDAWALLELDSDVIVIELKGPDGALLCASARARPDGCWHIDYWDASPRYVVDAL